MESDRDPNETSNIGVAQQSAHHKITHKKATHVGYDHVLIKLTLALTCLALLIFIVIGVDIIWHHIKLNNQPVTTTATEASQINTSEYQAVFLTNGQVYFGKITAVTPTYIKIVDIYYLQVQESVQPSTTNPSSSSASQAQLVKLGNEIHGPEDAMQIERPQVIYWENLKPSGKVTQAIDKYQSNQ